MLARTASLCGRVGRSEIALTVSATQKRLQSTAQQPDGVVYDVSKLNSVGRALDRYLKTVREHDKLMAKERAEFELGKRYLANIMGWDPAVKVTQEDIDKAIEYLFPSGLTDKNARPVMKPPEEILPRFHKFEFDAEGKPKDSLFFTLKPKFYGLLSEIGRKTQHLVKHYDDQLSRGRVQVAEEDVLDLGSSAWIGHQEISAQLGEKLSEEMYAQLVIAFDYLSSLPLAGLERDFIMSYRVPVVMGDNTSFHFGPPIPAAVIDAATGCRSATVDTKAKSVKVQVTVRHPGRGVYTVDGQHYDVFRSIMAREILLAPLIATDKFGQVDIEAKVTEGVHGLSAVPRAVRHGVALGLASLFPETETTLRQLKLLTQEPRKRERSKVNQPGARAKWIWKRR